MKKIKRGAVILIILCMICTFMPTDVFGTEALDIENHWANDKIQSWMDKGFVKGCEDGTFKPENNISRAEFITLVNRAFGYKESAAISYTDVNPDAWYANDIAIAKAAGYISGYPNNTMEPNGSISRSEAASILMKIGKLETSGVAIAKYTDASLLGWSKDAVSAVSAAKIMNGYPDGSFGPLTAITRAEAVVALDKSHAYRFKDVAYSTAGIYGPETGNSEIEGNVTVNEKGVTLRNMIIKGDLTIGKEVGNGEVTLKNVIVKGNTFINGGGLNSIYFVDVTIGKVYVQRDDGPVRIVASGSSAIEEILAGSDVKLEEVNLTGAGFEGITVAKNVAGGIDITLVGVKCERVDIKGEGVTLKADAKSTIGALTVDASNTKIEGKGKIAVAQVNAGGVSFEIAPVKTVTANGVLSPVVTPSGSGGGSGGGGSSTTVSVNAVTLTGSATVGSTLTAAVTPTGATASYQWKKSDTESGTYTNIAGATASTYVLTLEDADSYIKVSVTGSGSYTGTVSSLASAKVVDPSLILNLISAKTFDSDENGKIDLIQLTFDESVDDSTFIDINAIVNSSFITSSAVDSSVLSNPQGIDFPNDEAIYFLVNEIDGYNTKAEGTIDIPSADMIQSLSGKTLQAMNGVTITDNAGPVLVDSTLDLSLPYDNKYISLTFSEPLDESEVIDASTIKLMSSGIYASGPIDLYGTTSVVGNQIIIKPLDLGSVTATEPSFISTLSKYLYNSNDVTGGTASIRLNSGFAAVSANGENYMLPTQHSFPYDGLTLSLIKRVNMQSDFLSVTTTSPTSIKVTYSDFIESWNHLDNAYIPAQLNVISGSCTVISQDVDSDHKTLNFELSGTVQTGDKISITQVRNITNSYGDDANTAPIYAQEIMIRFNGTDWEVVAP